MSQLYIFSIILLFFMIPFAFAEPAGPQTEDIPIEWDYSACTLQYNPDDGVVIYNCLWTGFFEMQSDDKQKAINQKYGIEEKETFEVIIPEEPQFVELDEEVPQLTKLEAKIQTALEQLQKKVDKGTITREEQNMMTFLKQVLVDCEFGVDEGQPIQTYALHQWAKKADLSNLSTKNNQAYKELKMIQQACSAWDKYKGDRLRQYLDIARATDPAINPIWKPTATLQSVFDLDESGQTLSQYNQRHITERTFIDAEQDAKDMIVIRYNDPYGLTCSPLYEGDNRCISRGGFANYTFENNHPLRALDSLPIVVSYTLAGSRIFLVTMVIIFTSR